MITSGAGVVSTDSVFQYWCRACSAWWNADVSDDEARLLRRRQRASPDKPGVWHHPGLSACPTCGEPSTQHLPTERYEPRAAHRIPQFKNHESDAVSQKDVSDDVSKNDGPVASPYAEKERATETSQSVRIALGDFSVSPEVQGPFEVESDGTLTPTRKVW